MGFRYFHYSLKANIEIVPNNMTQPTLVHFLLNCIFTVFFSWYYGAKHPNGTVEAAFSLDMKGCSLCRLQTFQ